MHPPFEVAIVGDAYKEKLREWNQAYHAGAYLLGGEDEGELALLQNKKVEGETFIYVCKDKLCKLPVQEISRAYELLK